MPITLDLPDELLRNVMEITRTTSQCEGVRVGLEDFLRRNGRSDRQAELVDYFGRFPDFDLNLSETRATRCTNW